MLRRRIRKKIPSIKISTLKMHLLLYLFLQKKKCWWLIVLIALINFFNNNNKLFQLFLSFWMLNLNFGRNTRGGITFPISCLWVDNTGLPITMQQLSFHTESHLPVHLLMFFHACCLNKLACFTNCSQLVQIKISVTH